MARAAASDALPATNTASLFAAVNRLSPAMVAILLLPGAASYLAGVPPTDPAVLSLVWVLAPCIVVVDVAATFSRAATKLVSALHVTCTTRAPAELTA